VDPLKDFKGLWLGGTVTGKDEVPASAVPATVVLMNCRLVITPTLFFFNPFVFNAMVFPPFLDDKVFLGKSKLHLPSCS